MGSPPVTSPGVLLPGSFNPLHTGHREMARVAAAVVGRPAAFELSLWNVDKPALDENEVRRRLGQFGPEDVVWLTHAATVLEKARLFPGAVFAVGVDTLRRVADPRYYESNRQRRDAVIQSLAALGCRFVVFGRSCEGVFLTLDDLDLPSGLRAICLAAPETQFRRDVSSSELRRQG